MIKRIGNQWQIDDDWTQTEHRLLWTHGHKRYHAIIRGEDEATEADLAAWKRLCRLSRIKED